MLKNGIYITLSNAIRALMGIITIPLLIKILGIEEYGLWTLVYSTVALVFTIEGGIALAATFFITRDLPNPRALAPTFTVIVVATGLLATMAMLATYLGAEHIVKFFTALSRQQAEQAQQAIQVGSLAVGARLLQQIPISLQQATQQYGILSLLNLLLAAFTILALVPIAWAGGHTLEMMNCFAAANILVLLLHVAITVHWLRGRGLRPQWHWAMLMEFLKYSSFTWLSSIGSLLFMRGDRLIVGKILDIKTLGVYAAITDITMQINNLSAFAVQPLLPAIGSLWQPPQTDRPALQKVVRQGTQTNALVAFGLGSTLFYLAPQIFQAITTRLPTDPEMLCFRIAIVGYTIYSLNAVAYFALFAIGSARACSAIHLSSGLFALLCIFIGVSNGGLVGAAIGNLGYVTTLSMILVSMRRMQIPLKSCLNWLLFPLTWFSISVILCMLLAKYAVWQYQYILLCVQLAILAIWFVIALPLNTQKFRR
jgi:O-antigen/teichoic acid export membrane protein